MIIAERLLLVYFLLRPYYLFSSGGLQISDIFLLLSFLVFVVVAKLDTNAREKMFDIIRSNKLIIIFTLCTAVVNTAYFLYYPEFKFLLSTLYYIFILFAITVFLYFGSSGNFLVKISKIFKINLFIQLGIFLLGVGRYYSEERYMGTFNDPNQFAYYTLLSFFFVYVIKVLLSKKENVLLYFLIALFLIFQSASTGMLLGVGVFTVLISLYHLRNVFGVTYRKFRIAAYSILIAILVLPLLYILSLALQSDKMLLNAVYNESQTAINRIEGKLSKAEGGDSDMNLWEERGYDKIYKYPEKIIYGAGEGGYYRFTESYHDREVHATFPSILFYYGIVPFVLLIVWVYRKIKGSDVRVLIVYTALIIESFTLLNQRQALFWMILVLSSVHASSYVNKLKGKWN